MGGAYGQMVSKDRRDRREKLEGNDIGGVPSDEVWYSGERGTPQNTWVKLEVTRE